MKLQNGTHMWSILSQVVIRNRQHSDMTVAMSLDGAWMYFTSPCCPVGIKGEWTGTQMVTQTFLRVRLSEACLACLQLGLTLEPPVSSYC